MNKIRIKEMIIVLFKTWLINIGYSFIIGFLSGFSLVFMGIIAKDLYDTNKDLFSLISQFLILGIFVIVFGTILILNKDKVQIKPKKITKRDMDYVILLSTLSLGTTYIIKEVLFLSSKLNKSYTDTFVSSYESLEKACHNASIIVLGIIMILLYCVLPALVEELYYRCFLFNILKKHNVIVVAVSSSILFAFAHSSFIQGVYAFFGGLILSYGLVKTQNLTVTLLSHFIINLCGSFLVILLSNIINILGFSYAVTKVVLCILYLGSFIFSIIWYLKIICKKECQAS